MPLIEACNMQYASNKSKCVQFIHHLLIWNSVYLSMFYKLPLKAGGSNQFRGNNSHDELVWDNSRLSRAESIC